MWKPGFLKSSQIYVSMLRITIQAGKLAKDRGWAINIGGGFHHCCSNMGGRFCVYADISLCVKVTTCNCIHYIHISVYVNECMCSN